MANTFRDKLRDIYGVGLPGAKVSPDKRQISDGFGSLLDSALFDFGVRVDAAVAGFRVKPTWAALSALTGSADGQQGKVVGPDAGTHADPVSGATVTNAGLYSWSASPAGWTRIADLDTAEDVRADVGTNPNGVGGGNPLFRRARNVDGLLVASTVRNVYDPTVADAEWGNVYSDSTGAMSTGSTFSGASGDVAVEGDALYTISMRDVAGSWGVGAVVHCYDSAGTYIAALTVSGGLLVHKDNSRIATFRTPAGTATINFNLLYGGSGNATLFEAAKNRLMVSQTASAVPYKGYQQDALDVAGVPGMRALFNAPEASRNLYPSDLPDAGLSMIYLNDGKAYVSSGNSNSSITGKIPVAAGQTYTLSLLYGPEPFYITQEALFYAADGSFHSRVSPGASLAFSEGGQGFDTAVFTVPAGAAMVAFNLAYWDGTPNEAEFQALRRRIMLNTGSKRLPFEPYATASKLLPAPGLRGPAGESGLTVVLEGDYVYVRDRWSDAYDKVEAIYLGGTAGYSTPGSATPGRARKIPAGLPSQETFSAFYAASEADWFANNGDDPPPIWFNGQLGGGNHALVAQQVTANGHGKANEDVGSRWTDGASKVWVLARVADANTLVFAAANTGTATQWVSNGAITGNLTHSAGATHTGAVTVSAQSGTQLYPWLQRLTHRIALDGAVVSADGIYPADEVVVTETYGIPNAASVLDYLIANVGSALDPVYNADAIQTQIEVEIAYSLRPGEAMTVAYDVYNVQDYTQDHLVGMQAGAPKLGATDRLFLYIPRTTAEGTSGLDFSQSAEITNNASTFNVEAAEWADPSDPPSLFAEIVKTSAGAVRFGQMLGYSHLVGLGVPATRAAAAANAIQISPINKMYPWALDTAAGAVAGAGEFHTLLGFRGYFDADPAVTAQLVYSWGGKRYWALGLVAALTDIWIRPPFGVHRKLVGKRISVTGNGRKSASLTLRSEFVSPKGVLLSTAAGGGWMVAEVG